MNATNPLTLTDIEARVTDVLRRHISPPTNAPRNRASSAGDECPRRLVYRRTHGDQATPHDEHLQSIFDVGREHESALVKILEDAGTPLLERERMYEWPELELAGSCDGKIAVNGVRQLVDAKSCHPFIFDRLADATDSTELLTSRHPWIRHYPGQLDAYIAMDLRAGGKSEQGGFIFRNKATGRIKVIPHALDANRLSAMEAKLRLVNEHVHAGTLPERVDPEIGACDRCPFARICLPDEPRQDGLALTTDPMFLDMLDARAALAPKAKQFKAIDDEIKARLKATDFATLIAGDYQITKRHQSRKEHTVKASEFDVITITGMKGESDVDG